AFNVTVQSQTPVTVHTQGLVFLSGDLGQNDVRNEGELKIRQGVALTLASFNGTALSEFAVGGDLTVGKLEGSGFIRPDQLDFFAQMGPPISNVGTIRVGLNDASSTFAGSIFGDSLIKIG